MRILVIDDSHTSRLWTSEALRREGWTVELAANGAQGVEAALRGRFDAVLLDFVLPDMDGLRVMQELAAAGVAAPCVVLSAAPNPEVTARFRAAGVREFLAKEGLSPPSLVHAVRRAVDAGARPVRIADPPRALPTEADEPMRREPGVALIVDDTHTTRVLLRRILERNGWTVVEAPDGKHAVDVAVAASPDVVLLDHVLPDGEGVDLVSVFSAMRVPVVGLTGHGDENVAERFLRAGAAEYLPKDALTEETLLTALARVAWVGAEEAAVAKRR